MKSNAKNKNRPLILPFTNEKDFPILLPLPIRLWNVQTTPLTKRIINRDSQVKSVKNRVS